MYSGITAGNGTRRKTVIFTADIFAVYFSLPVHKVFLEPPCCKKLQKSPFHDTGLENIRNLKYNWVPNWSKRLIENECPFLNSPGHLKRDIHFQSVFISRKTRNVFEREQMCYCSSSTQKRKGFNRNNFSICVTIARSVNIVGN